MPRCAIAVAALFLLSTAARARAEDRDVPGFEAVSIESGFHATVEIGARTAVRIEADADVLPLIETRVEDGALHVGFKPHARVHSEHEIRVAIRTPQLRALSASGGSVVRATMTRAPESAIRASGGSEVHVRGVDADRLAAQGSGGSVLDLEGRATTLALQMSGGTRLLGRDLSVRDVVVQASGGSQGELRADGKITGALSGGSEVHVRGGARATAVATSGGSMVEVDE